ncbi:hypothetical protein FTO70_01025 [Methanosarcina sp. KYL-1]|uniref:DUF2298 domain-containing protein n=1 Tax=Methanosarcina sp. KYL-1 TaxID=2602068 RepID=UPI00210109DC|nr:DUF2298 domain-containing protein [Methanosarcina sp. KYL-1]MCQ1534302.1 hypothetical protein [Methanosarcina sp. KYL-1]
MSDYLHVILWFILIQGLGLISIPLAGALGNRLADGGYSASRTLGIVLVTYLSWIFSYIWSFKVSTVIIAILVLCLISINLYRKQRILPNRNVVLLNEFVFTAGFFFFLLVRMYLPEIHGHEKFMDFAFLNTVIRTSSFPPPDPWFAGGTLDFYYYLGYLSVGVPGKLSAVEPSILFNLAIALTFALSLNLLFGIGYNLTRGNVKFGVITAAFGALLGNIQGLIGFVSIYILKNPVSMGYYWSSSRVIPYTINEFPYFSFIHGDLHAHMLAIPFQLLVLAFLLNIYFRRNGNSAFENAPAFLAFSISLGFLFPANAWDFPIYFGLMVSVIFAFYSGSVFNSSSTFYSRSAFYSGSGIRKKDISRAFSGFSRTLVLISTLSFLLYLPFYLSFHPQAAEGFGLLDPELRTGIDKFFILFGLFLYLIFSFLITHLSTHLDFKQKVRYFTLGFGIPALLSIEWGTPLLLVLLPLLGLSFISFLKDLSQRSSTGFVSLLAAAAAFITLMCEFIYLEDPCPGNYARMNTVFKFYMHAWIFLAIAASYSYYEIRSRYGVRTQEHAFFPEYPENAGNKAWTVLFLLLLISCTFFPVVGTLTRIQDMQAKPALDGMEYMKELDRGDYNAIKWMQENIEGTPVILEAASDQSSYSYTSRVSANTGLPTVLGWARHERFWGRDRAEVRTRIKDISSIYNTDSEEKAIELIEKYNISYVYIGELERDRYGGRLDKFEDETYFELVYLGSVKIYRIKNDF